MKTKTKKKKSSLATRKNQLLKKIKNVGIRHSNFLTHDIKCGMHSGIPDCCIYFWITEYTSFTLYDTKLTMENSDRDKYFEKINKLDVIGKRIGYIPCRKCLKSKNFAKVKKCKCHLISIIRR